jgi:hypothetical protein
MLEFGLPIPHALREAEGPHLLAENFGVEERFGFECHLFSGRLCRDGKKPSAFLLGTDRGDGLTEHRTSNIQHPIAKSGGKANQGHPKPTASQILGIY